MDDVLLMRMDLTPSEGQLAYRINDSEYKTAFSNVDASMIPSEKTK